MAFDTTHAKQMLIQLGEQCLALADNLGHGGRRLNKQENALLRQAYLPQFMENLNLVKVGYVTNDVELMETSTEVLHDIQRDLTPQPKGFKDRKKA